MILLSKMTKLYRSRSKSGSISISRSRSGNVDIFSYIDGALSSKSGIYGRRSNSRSGDKNMGWHWGAPLVKPSEFIQVRFNRDLESLLEESL